MLTEHFSRRKRFRRSNWSENLEKTEEKVIRKNLIRKVGPRDTKASPGRTDAKVQIFLHRQISCGMETYMDDCVAAVAAAVVAYRCRVENQEYQSVGTYYGVAPRERCNRIPITYM